MNIHLQDIRSINGPRGEHCRLAYHPEWSQARPWVSYINGTAGLHFATLEEGKQALEAKGFQFA